MVLALMTLWAEKQFIQALTWPQSGRKGSSTNSHSVVVVAVRISLWRKPAGVPGFLNEISSEFAETLTQISLSHKFVQAAAMPIFPASCGGNGEVVTAPALISGALSRRRRTDSS